MGLPGSGKTTLANILCDYVCEADDYFCKDNIYNFDASKLHEAHKQCYDNTKDVLERKHDVAVSNTFLSTWERKKYIELAKEYNANIIVIECTGNFKSIHNIPEKTMENMKRRYEPFNRFKEIGY